MRGHAYLTIVNLSPLSWFAELSGTSQVIGRAREAEIPVPPEYRSVSRRHAEVWSERGKRWIRDLSSRSGTRINGVCLQPQRAYQISTGDRLQLGALELVLVRTLHVAEDPEVNPDSTLEKAGPGSPPAARQPRTAPLPPEVLIGFLTHAEREVVLWIGRGCTDLKEIGRKLFRSPNTVRTQLNSIYKKLGVHSRDELMAVIRRSNVPDASHGE